MRPHPESVRGFLPFFCMLIMIGAVVSLAAAGLLPTSLSPPSLTKNTEKTRLLETLPTVDRVAYEPDSMVLYVGGTPVMIVWTQADPVELWSATGRFIAPLTFEEYRQVVMVTSEMIGDCRDDAPPGHPLRNSDLSHATA